MSYIEFTKDTRLEDKKDYIVVLKYPWQEKDCDFSYCLFTWYSNDDIVDEFDFVGEGFYYYNVEYGGYFKMDCIVAYKEVEKYVIKMNNK